MKLFLTVIEKIRPWGCQLSQYLFTRYLCFCLFYNSLGKYLIKYTSVSGYSNTLFLFVTHGRMQNIFLLIQTLCNSGLKLQFMEISIAVHKLFRPIPNYPKSFIRLVPKKKVGTILIQTNTSYFPLSQNTDCTDEDKVRVINFSQLCVKKN